MIAMVIVLGIAVLVLALRVMVLRDRLHDTEQLLRWERIYRK